MDGVLVIDKPTGWTSHDVVAKIRSVTKIKKVGHTGTLDPFATGVLPLTMGRATRLTSYFQASDKEYRGVIRFGFATSTYDVDGDPVGTDTSPELDFLRLEAIFTNYTGSITQQLPPYSAKKFQGKPLYAYALRGIEVDPGTKQVTVKSLKLLGVKGAEAEFEITCTSGTYVRTLAHDIGRDYGSGAHLLHLRRIRSGSFSIDAAVPLKDEHDYYPREIFIDRIIPLHDLLTEIPAIVISDGDIKKLVNGMDLNLLTVDWESERFRLLDSSGNLVSLACKVQAFTSQAPQPACWIRIHPQVTFQ
ncbi:MAG TPA: tRNA pseudouridine(55) synthase TruB [Acidobacteriota bacterium]|nr:tRNA pseudouridine(55) synthase TruB [Acidobacteriota bacterium]